jgi:para-nitrobenzyl esterase
VRTVALLLGVCACGAGVVSGGPGDDGGTLDASADATPGAFPDPLLTEDGPVHGRDDADAGLHVYLGIPYAAPPVGALRFHDPEAPPPWTEVRDATRFGHFCPQLDSSWGPAPDPARQSEDCLTLNVWTPAAHPDDALPVMVYLHGGSFVAGGSAHRAYEGGKLAAEGHVVVVTLNYRLGPLGFLAHAAMTAESAHHSSGNFGILDQIRALTWVRSNVSRFGGDPERVTIFGHSAGGASVCTLYASPLARGLFAGAIMQSGFCSANPENLAEMEALGEQAARALGCATAADVLACLRAAPVASVLHALAQGVQLEEGVHYRPIVDGYVLSQPSPDVLADGEGADVPFIVGTAADEGSIYANALALSTVASYQAWVSDRWPISGPEILAMYPASSDAAVHAALTKLITHWLYTCPAGRIARAVAENASVWRYEFRHVSWDAAQRDLGAYHGAELPYVFHRFKVDANHMWNADDEALAGAMIGAWAHFAATGDASPWAEYDAANQLYEVLEWPLAAAGDLDGPQCELWDHLSH